MIPKTQIQKIFFILSTLLITLTMISKAKTYSVSISLSNVQVNEYSNYEFTFFLTASFKATDYLQITLPSEISLTKSLDISDCSLEMSSSNYSSSNTISQCQANSNVVTIMISELVVYNSLKNTNYLIFKINNNLLLNPRSVKVGVIKLSYYNSSNTLLYEVSNNLTFSEIKLKDYISTSYSNTTTLTLSSLMFNLNNISKLPALKSTDYMIISFENIYQPNADVYSSYSISDKSFIDETKIVSISSINNLNKDLSLNTIDTNVFLKNCFIDNNEVDIISFTFNNIYTPVSTKLFTNALKIDIKDLYGFSIGNSYFNLQSFKPREFNSVTRELSSTTINSYSNISFYITIEPYLQPLFNIIIFLPKEYQLENNSIVEAEIKIGINSINTSFKSIIAYSSDNSISYYKLTTTNTISWAYFLYVYNTIIFTLKNIRNPDKPLLTQGFKIEVVSNQKDDSGNYYELFSSNNKSTLYNNDDFSNDFEKGFIPKASSFSDIKLKGYNNLSGNSDNIIALMLKTSQDNTSKNTSVEIILPKEVAYNFNSNDTKTNNCYDLSNISTILPGVNTRAQIYSAFPFEELKSDSTILFSSNCNITYNSQTNTIRIKDFYSKDTIASQTTLILILNNIVNPKYSTTTSNFIVNLIDNTYQQMGKDNLNNTENTDLVYNTNKDYEDLSLYISESELTFISSFIDNNTTLTEANWTLNFKNTNPLPINSLITINFSEDVVNMVSSNDNSTFNLKACSVLVNKVEIVKSCSKPITSKKQYEITLNNSISESSNISVSLGLITPRTTTSITYIISTYRVNVDNYKSLVDSSNSSFNPINISDPSTFPISVQNSALSNYKISNFTFSLDLRTSTIDKQIKSYDYNSTSNTYSLEAVNKQFVLNETDILDISLPDEIELIKHIIVDNEIEKVDSYGFKIYSLIDYYQNNTLLTNSIEVTDYQLVSNSPLKLSIKMSDLISNIKEYYTSFNFTSYFSSNSINLKFVNLRNQINNKPISDFSFLFKDSLDKSIVRNNDLLYQPSTLRYPNKANFIPLNGGFVNYYSDYLIKFSIDNIFYLYYKYNNDKEEADNQYISKNKYTVNIIIPENLSTKALDNSGVIVKSGIINYSVSITKLNNKNVINVTGNLLTTLSSLSSISIEMEIKKLFYSDNSYSSYFNYNLLDTDGGYIFKSLEAISDNNNLRVYFPCEFPCLECMVNDKTKCSSCYGLENIGYSGLVLPYLSNSSCVSECPVKYYSLSLPNEIISLSQKTIENNYNDYVVLKGETCLLCGNNCDYCSSTNSNNCTDCSSNYFKNNDNTCVSQCAEGLYSDKITKTCKLCSDNCYTCSNSTEFCTSCSTQIGLILDYTNKCVSSCSSGYFENSILNTCDKCTSNCSTCNKNSTTCTTCNEGYLLNKETSSCNDCEDGYYKTTSKKCSKCDDSCLTCTTGSTCKSCPAGMSINMITQLCEVTQTSCSNKEFYYQGLCYKCLNSNCSSCEYANSNEANSSYDSSVFNPYSTVCLSCNEGFILNADKSGCSNICASGTTYISKLGSVGKCKNCSENCKECNLSVDYCTSCEQGLYLYNNKCIESCPSNYYSSPKSLNHSENICVECESNCESCNSKGCLVCSKGYYLNNNKCLLSCEVEQTGNIFVRECFESLKIYITREEKEYVDSIIKNSNSSDTSTSETSIIKENRLRRLNGSNDTDSTYVYYSSILFSLDYSVSLGTKLNGCLIFIIITFIISVFVFLPLKLFYFQNENKLAVLIPIIGLIENSLLWYFSVFLFSYYYGQITLFLTVILITKIIINFSFTIAFYFLLDMENYLLLWKKEYSNFAYSLLVYCFLVDFKIYRIIFSRLTCNSEILNAYSRHYDYLNKLHFYIMLIDIFLFSCPQIIFSIFIISNISDPHETKQWKLLLLSYETLLICFFSLILKIGDIYFNKDLEDSYLEQEIKEKDRNNVKELDTGRKEANRKFSLKEKDLNNIRNEEIDNTTVNNFNYKKVHQKSMITQNNEYSKSHIEEQENDNDNSDNNHKEDIDSSLQDPSLYNKFPKTKIRKSLNIYQSDLMSKVMFSKTHHQNKYCDSPELKFKKMKIMSSNEKSNSNNIRNHRYSEHVSDKVDYYEEKENNINNMNFQNRNRIDIQDIEKNKIKTFNMSTIQSNLNQTHNNIKDSQGIKDQKGNFYFSNTRNLSDNYQLNQKKGVFDSYNTKNVLGNTEKRVYDCNNNSNNIIQDINKDSLEESSLPNKEEFSCSDMSICDSDAKENYRNNIGNLKQNNHQNIYQNKRSLYNRRDYSSSECREESEIQDIQNRVDSDYVSGNFDKSKANVKASHLPFNTNLYN